MKVYIAAPFFIPQQVALVEAAERELGRDGLDYFSPRSEGTLKNMSVEEQKQTRKQIFDSNIQNMNECTHMLAIVEYKDTGTIFEMGYFHAQGKPIIMVSSKLESINVMLGQAAESIATSPEQAANIWAGLDVGVDISSWT